MPSILAGLIVAEITVGIVLVTSRGMGPILWTISRERGVHFVDLLIIVLAVPFAVGWVSWIREGPADG